MDESEFHPANFDLHDEFDDAIAMIQSMREVRSFIYSYTRELTRNKQKGKTMSDTDRREMASSFILQLAASLDLDDESSEE